MYSPSRLLAPTPEVSGNLVRFEEISLGRSNGSSTLPPTVCKGVWNGDCVWVVVLSTPRSSAFLLLILNGRSD